MNMPRMLILAVAVIAAGAAAFLARGLLGGGTPQVAARIAPPTIPTTEVLVASAPLQPGQPLSVNLVHWQKWPRSAVDSSFMTHESTPNLETALTNAVVRAPLVEGEPLTSQKFVHTDSAGFMAATLQPGMRAVSIPVTTESGAGGFILPNDRVDLLMSELVSDTPRRYRSHVVLANVRVLAMDQTYKQDNNQKVVLAKTATLELTPDQARMVVRAQAAGPLSLALRSLADGAKPAAVLTARATPAPSSPAAAADADSSNDDSGVDIIRFGVAASSNGRKE
ncbi:MAG TPA: Flp pilus assembly protein CpaB [Rhizomicrobium sp.]|nr:Flp pilus assembly protein CpaB [Rhizomicrobium sp.]